MLYGFEIYEDRAPPSVEETRSAIEELIDRLRKIIGYAFYQREELTALFQKHSGGTARVRRNMIC